MEDPNYFSQLSQIAPQARSVEELTCPLLKMLGAATGLETTYLTTIDLDAGVQHVQFAYNTGALHIPEGLDVPWSDTLCKRALDEGRTYTCEVAEIWGDSDAAKALGIRTYVSVPVRTQSGELLGTLCAASADRKPLTPTAEPMLQLFSWLVGSLVERERLVDQLKASNSTLSTLALTDVLTNLPNRRAIVDELARLLARGRREQQTVLVGLLDLDGFKQINDTYGHLAGDQLLIHVGQRMRSTLREVDTVGRVGGDEFVVLAPGPHAQINSEAAAGALRERLFRATMGAFDLGQHTIDYAGASVGIVVIDPARVDAEAALRLADQQMYDAKRARRQQTHTPSASV